MGVEHRSELSFRPYYVIGLMSGTSGDGIDAAVVRIVPRHDVLLRPHMELLAHDTYPFENNVRETLFSLFHTNTVRIDTLVAFDTVLGELFAQACHRIAEAANVPLHHVDYIGSHGQTIYHIPPTDTQHGSTLQIGNAAIIAERTRVPVVSDFRRRDMALGGHGAPLVPYADWVLFSERHAPCIVQNIGGIGNATVLPTGGTLNDVVAFDTGPGNMIIDAVVHHITEGRQTADWNGELAKQGTANTRFVQRLLQDDYFTVPPPKSTGREKFGQPYAVRFMEQARRHNITDVDMIATATLFTALSIADQYKRFVEQWNRMNAVIIGGGGAYNPVLLDMLQEALHPVVVTTHEAYGIPSGAKEAMAFALLAWATANGLPANVPSVTGATRRCVLGNITPGMHLKEGQSL